MVGLVMDHCTAVVAISESASHGACFVSMPFESIILISIRITFCLFSLLAKNASFLDLKGVVSVNDTFVPNMPFVRLKCVASFVSGPEAYSSNTRITDYEP
jgi:hypothetical protein